MNIYRDYFIAIISQFLSYIVPFILIVYLSHIFSKKLIVLLFFSQALTQSFVSITDYGYAIRGSRIFALENDRSKLAEIAGRIYTTKFVLLIFCIFSLFCIFFFSAYVRNHILFILSYMGVLVANIVFPGWAFIGRKNFKFIYLNNLISYITLLVLTFLIVNETTSFITVALIYSFSFLLPAIIGFLVMKREIGVRFTFRILLIWEELTEGFSVFLSSGVKGFYISFPLTFLGVISNQHLLYNFSYPDKLVKLFVGFCNFIMRLSLPFFLKGNIKRLRGEYLLLILSFIFVFILIYFKKPILGIVFNVKSIDLTYELLMFSLPLKFMYLYIMYSYFFACQKESILWKIFSIGLVILSVLITLSIELNVSVGYSILFSDFLILCLMMLFRKRGSQTIGISLRR